MTIILSASAAASAAASKPSLVGLTTGLGISALGKLMDAGPCSSLGGAVGASTSAATVLGTIVGGTMTGGLASGASAAFSSGATNLTTSLIGGPVGMLVLGTVGDQLGNCSYDCWKPILRDESLEPSSGMLLKDVLSDSRIKNVTVNDTNSFPEILMENIWDEKFMIEYVTLPSANLAIHAVRVI